jgi:hypothetical protein
VEGRDFARRRGVTGATITSDPSDRARSTCLSVLKAAAPGVLRCGMPRSVAARWLGLVALTVAGFSWGTLLRSSPARALDGGDDCYRIEWAEFVEIRRLDGPGGTSQLGLWRERAALEGEGGGVSALLIFLNSPSEGGVLTLEIQAEARP